MSPDEMKAFFEPYDDKTMSAHPVSKLISTRGAHTNIPEVSQSYKYEELENL